jgi:hypothetical protein
MGYDAWKATDISEWDRYEQPDPEPDVWLPRYRLHVNYDHWLGITTARLYVQQLRGERAWATLDEAWVKGDDRAGAVRSMRDFRRLSRGVL